MEPENRTHHNEKAQREAAARVVRDQLDAIYSGQSNVAKTPSQGSHRQHTNNHTATKQTPAQNLEQYHSQWQEYYQRYYENYYVGHLNKVLENYRGDYQSSGEHEKEDLKGLKNRIQEKARDKAKQARRSRHFVPVMSGLVAIFVIAFLQYNQFIIANVQAYVSPGTIDPQNIVVDPNADTSASPEPKLIIPKINVDVPVIYGSGPDHDSQMAAMQKGVSHFAIPGANSVPGQVGNTVFSGHSSNDLFDPGDYKFIFVQLDKLNVGDTIYVNYNSVRYTYTITKKEVVLPTQIEKLTAPTDKPILTLITCTPVGTAEKRLLITAEQVVPDPTKARPSNENNESTNSVMTGNAPTLLERLFGSP